MSYISEARSLPDEQVRIASTKWMKLDQKSHSASLLIRYQWEHQDE